MFHLLDCQHLQFTSKIAMNLDFVFDLADLKPKWDWPSGKSTLVSVKETHSVTHTLVNINRPRRTRDSCIPSNVENMA